MQSGKNHKYIIQQFARPAVFLDGPKPDSLSDCSVYSECSVNIYELTWNQRG